MTKDDCHGWCCRTIDTTVYLGYTLPISNLAVAIVLFSSQVFLLFHLWRSYTLAQRPRDLKSQQTIPPLYYIYFQVVCIWFFCEAISLLLPSDALSVQIFTIVLWSGCGFFDNCVILWLCMKKDDNRSILIVVVLSALSALSYPILLVIFPESRTSCSWCGLYIPLPQVIYNYTFFGILYSLLYLLLLTNFFGGSFPFSLLRTHIRPTLSLWLLFLQYVYWSSCLGLLLLWVWNIDFGYCIISTSVFVYNCGYALSLYRTLILDAKYLQNAQKLKQGGLASGLTDEENALLVEIDPRLQKVMEEDPSIKVILRKEIEIGERIGVGGFGEVFKGRWNETDVAVKQLYGQFAKSSGDEEEEEEGLEEFVKEVKMLSQLRHPNILLFLGATLEPGSRCIVTEFMPNGNLFDLLHTPYLLRRSHSLKKEKKKRKEVRVTKHERLKMLIQTAKGMAYLHSHKPIILHRDLKSHNLLLDEASNVKIADFGHSRIKEPSSTMTRIGTPQWMAPEVLREERYSEKADVYSFGVIVWEVLTGLPPFAGMKPIRVAVAVGYKGLRLKIPQESLKEWNQVMEGCWKEKAEERMEWKEVVGRLEKMKGNAEWMEAWEKAMPDETWYYPEKPLREVEEEEEKGEEEEKEMNIQEKKEEEKPSKEKRKPKFRSEGGGAKVGSPSKGFVFSWN